MRKTILFLIAFVLLFSLAATPFNQGVKVFFEPKLKKLDNKPRVLIISAFAPELSLLLQETDIKHQYVINGHTLTLGTTRGVDTVLTLSGVSVTNAAANTQQAFDLFNIQYAVFSGIAGGVNPELNIGDVVIPEQWAEYLEMHAARQLEDGSYSHVSDLDNFGMLFPRTVCVTQKGGPADSCTNMRWFPVDQEMFTVAHQVANNVQLDTCGLDRSGNEVCLSHEPKIVTGGSGVSGPWFVDNAEFRDYTFATFSEFGPVSSLDMESAQFQHVCYMNATPCLVFRSLSDLAGGGPGENEIGTFFNIAANNSAKVLLGFLEEWAVQPRK
jgi:adenosylhomocysteine nucleosidase